MNGGNAHSSSSAAHFCYSKLRIQFGCEYIIWNTTSYKPLTGLLFCSDAISWMFSRYQELRSIRYEQSSEGFHPSKVAFTSVFPWFSNLWLSIIGMRSFLLVVILVEMSAHFTVIDEIHIGLASHLTGVQLIFDMLVCGVHCVCILL